MGGRGSSSGMVKSAISKELYSEWRSASTIAEEGKALAFKDPNKNWNIMSDKVNSFEKVDAKLAKIAAKNYGNGYTYNDASNKAFKKLSDGSTITISGASGGMSNGVVIVERSMGWTKLDRGVFANYEEAYKFANGLTSKKKKK